MASRKLFHVSVKCIWCMAAIAAPWFRFPCSLVLARRASSVLGRFPKGNLALMVRGGAEEKDDEERYSRQVFAVGKRAHGLIRSSTIFLDGPPASGLLYETAKNLALSGIRKLVFLIPPDDEEDSTYDHLYHNQEFDDLGNAYLRAARSELSDEVSDPMDILVAYVERLNPSIDVSVVRDRSSLVENDIQGRKVIVVIDRPYDTQVKLNQVARTASAAFVAIETAGVYGRVFCDFGPAFDVYDSDGETPLETPLLKIEQANNLKDTGKDEMVIIHCVDGEKHDVSKGDIVKFKFRNGDVSVGSCIVEKVLTPFKFEAKIEIYQNSMNDALNEWNDAVSFSRAKETKTITFASMEETVSKAKEDASVFTACDLDKSWDETRRRVTFGCFQSLPLFVKRHKRLPRGSDRKVFSSLYQEAMGTDVSKPARIHVRNFVSGCAAKFSPLQAIFGAIGAQEALKAVTGLYSPVKQFLMYDCDEVLGSGGTDLGETSGMPTSDSGLRYIIGDECVNELQSKRVFVVGAGAIGCEILKNLVAMGMGTRKKGKIILTDMDTIEKSNLSRQFLFRDSDIGKFKSLAAKDSVLRFQSSARIEAHSAKVGAGEVVFDERFWEKKVDTVLNALDNVDARLFIDGQCVANQKALVDAGTLGSKGNVQVVVPFQSESYSSSVDPPEEAIPVCTLKNFPYAISHTIQWGRDLFDGGFRLRPLEANKFVASFDGDDIGRFASQAVHTMGEEAALIWSKNLVDDLIMPSDPEDAVQHALTWAAKLAKALFYDAIRHLIEEHPLDSCDEDGEPFWSGSRRPPTPVKFIENSSCLQDEIINQNLVDFVRSAARLRLESYTSVSQRGVSITEDDANTALSKSKVGEEKCEEPNDQKSVEECVASTLLPLQDVDSFPEMILAEFEKDDDSNDHVAFVTAASNLRAICYGIPPVDTMETRRIAGNIIPAMITTTAFVSALSCVEMIKLVQEVPLKKHKNAFINLALPFFAFTVPLPAESTPGLRGRAYTLWDRLFVKESRKSATAGGMKMKLLLSKLKKLAADESESVGVSSISLGPFLLYANFLHEEDAELHQSTVWDTITEALDDPDEGAREEDAGVSVESSYSADDRKFPLTVTVEDLETGEEAELPVVYLERFVEK